MKGICLRCGKDFVRLDKHLSNKKVCNATHLDIPRERIIPEYSTLINEFLKIQKKLNSSVKCDYCGKVISKKSNMARHKKTHPTIIQQQINYNSTVINGDINIGTTTNVFNIILNNFGEEEDIDYDIAKQIIESEFTEDATYLVKYFKKLYIDKENNRNIYLENVNSKKMHIYKDNKWKPEDKKIIERKIIKKIIKNLKNHIKVYGEKENNDNKYVNINNVIKLLIMNKNDEVITTEKGIEYSLLYNKDILEKNFELMTN